MRFSQALDQLRKEDSTGTSGNYGMLDQRAALQWVQKSIASFGGDRAKVTIFGESSGGTSVAYHVVNPRSAGLFKRAILESPGQTCNSSVTPHTTYDNSVTTLFRTTGNRHNYIWRGVLPPPSSTGRAKQPASGVLSMQCSRLMVYTSADVCTFFF